MRGCRVLTWYLLDGLRGGVSRCLPEHRHTIHLHHVKIPLFLPTTQDQPIVLEVLGVQQCCANWYGQELPVGGQGRGEKGWSGSQAKLTPARSQLQLAQQQQTQCLGSPFCSSIVLDSMCRPCLLTQAASCRLYRSSEVEPSVHEAELATARSQLHAAEQRQRMEQKQEAELQQQLLVK
eukprot:690384-Pelagomonas_calceolata.AAC.1